MSDIYCALTGEGPDEEELIDLGDDDELPPGWIRVTVERRLPNLARVELDAAKKAICAAQLEQYGEVGDEVKRLVELQVDATFAALEAQNPPTLIREESIYICPPEGKIKVTKHVRGLLDSLTFDEETVGEFLKMD